MADEVARLQALLAEAQQSREIAERRREEEQRRREEAERGQHEEQRRREEAERGQHEEQRRREEAERGQHEEQRRREEAERGQHEEQRRREHAERVAVNQNLADFLESCHALCKKILPVTDPSSATRGLTTDPTSRLFPQQIAAWQDFGERQQRTWITLSSIPELWHTPLYTSIAACKYVEDQIDPVGSEDDLRFLQRLTVENMVKDMHTALLRNHELAPGLLPPGLLAPGQVSFENQASFREAEIATLSDAMTGLAIHHEGSQRRRNTRADQFCVLWREDGSVRPLIAIEYKAPHKLTIEEICTGLQSDIQPERDVIDQEEEDFTSICRRLLAAVVTQLFSYMIDKCVQYGYICTGEAFIFLHIPENPTIIYYSINIPKKDYEVDTENRLERTAVSQVFAFIQQALSQDPPGQAWVDHAKASLKSWKVEFTDVLATIPETERKSKEASEYRPRQWRKGMQRSPIRFRLRSRTDRKPYSRSADTIADFEGHSKQAYENPRASTGIFSRRAQSHPHPESTLLLSQLPPWRLPRARGRPFLSERDRARPGAHIEGPFSPARYTLVAKATAHTHQRHLEHEAAVYHQLRGLQGRYVPVCCGTVDLDLPYHYDGVELRHILLLSWAGRSLAQLEFHDEEFAASIKPSCDEQAAEAYQAIRGLQVLHCDEAPRNMVFDTNTRQLMIIDFERSIFVGRQALRELSSNRNRKRALDRHTWKADHRKEASRINSTFSHV
ncbi:hypothetical protein BST61_g2926 [Cercospora zeina]